MKEVHLDYNQIDGSRMKIIQDMLSSNRSLVYLNMNNCQLGPDAADFFAIGLSYNVTLKTLLLRDNEFGDEGSERINTSLSINKGFNLEHLDLSKNFINDRTAVTMIQALAENKNLKTLSLEDNTLGEPFATALIEMVRDHPCISMVKLQDNFVPLKMVYELGKLLKANAMKTDPKAVPKLRKDYQYQVED